MARCPITAIRFLYATAGHRRLRSRAATKPKRQCLRCTVRRTQAPGGRRKAVTSSFLPSPELHDDLKRLWRPAVGIGFVLSIASIAGAFSSPGDFFRSYLMGYLFWLGLTLG